MRTGRSLTVCCSLLPGGGVLPGGGGGVLCLVLGGGVLLGPGGRWGVGWFSLLGRGVSAWSGGVLLGPGGGFSLPGGVSAWSGGVLRRPPPVNRITDTCKSITLATTSLRPVKIKGAADMLTKTVTLTVRINKAITTLDCHYFLDFFLPVGLDPSVPTELEDRFSFCRNQWNPENRN